MMRTLGEYFLALVLPPTDRRHVQDELDELYEVQVRRKGEAGARRWRRRQVWRFVVRALPTFWWRRPLSGFLALMANRDGTLGVGDTARQDLRFAFRSFRRKPGFSLIVITILGIGIGATTTIFSVVDTVILRPLPYPEPERLVHFGGFSGVRPIQFSHWRDALTSYEGIGAAWNVPATLTGEGPARNLRASRVTPDLLPILGAVPSHGRLLQEGDYGGGQSVGVLGHEVWESQWGSDPGILGRTILVEGNPTLVVGVVGPDFHPPEAVTGPKVDLWLPFDVDNPDISTWGVLSVAGRLKRNVEIMAAQAELRSHTEALSEEFPDLLVRQDGSVIHTNLVPLRVATFGRVGPSLILLMWAVLLMLAIACANVANMLLAQGTARVRELALRGALGAGRRRITRQLLTESLSLSLLGGLLGVGLAFVGIALFLHFKPGEVPRIEGLAVDLRILVFALAASILTGTLFGLFPAFHASRRSVGESIKEGGPASLGIRRGRRLRRGLVITEIALALVLLTSAGLFFRSLVSLSRVDPGFQPENIVLIPLQLGSDYDANGRRQFSDQVQNRLRAVPGVVDVAAGMTAPFQYLGASRCCIWHEVVDETFARTTEPLPMVMAHPVTPSFFATLGSDIIQGREFDSSDNEGDGLVTVINDLTARHFFGEGDAVGNRLRIGGWGTFTVIGVSRGIHHWGMGEGVSPGVYVPYAQWGAGLEHYVLMARTTLDLESFAPLVREAISSVDPALPAEEILTMRERVGASMAGQRFLTILLGTFASVALILATAGIYGTMLQVVGQRRREMGIRMALGASGRQVILSVLRGGLSLTLVGIVAGLGASFAVMRFIRSWLFDSVGFDPLTLAGVVGVLGVGAFAACLAPAMKASRTDPLETLTVE